MMQSGPPAGTFFGGKVFLQAPFWWHELIRRKKNWVKKTTNKHYIVCNITTNTKHIFDIAFCIWGMPSSIHIWKFSFLDGMLQYISFQSPLSILKPTSTPFSFFLSYLIVKVDNKSIAWMYWTWWLKERSLSLKEHTTLSIKIRSEGRIPYKTIVTFTLVDDVSTDWIKASSVFGHFWNSTMYIPAR